MNDSPLPCRLLLVDDAADVRLLISRLLQRHRCDVVTTATGRDALDEARRRRFDAILLDLELPDVHGIELLGRLRALPTCTETPFIALTAHDDPRVARRCLQAGFTSYLAKPVRWNVLLPMLERVAAPPPVLDPMIADLIEPFVRRIAVALEGFTAPLAADALVRLGRVGHDVKGSAAPLGFETLGHLGAQLDIAAKAGCADDAMQIRAHMQDALAGILDSVPTDGVDRRAKSG